MHSSDYSSGENPDSELLRRLAAEAKIFEPFMIALGRLATAWSEYELHLNIYIWELANVEKIAGSCMTSQMIGPGPRLRCLLSLLELRKAPAEIINAFNSHATKAEKIGRQRNRLIHDPWMLESKTGQINRIEITADKHVRHAFVGGEVKEIDELFFKLSKLIDEAESLWSRVETELPPWPRTQFDQSPGIALRHTNQGSTTPPNQPPASQK